MLKVNKAPGFHIFHKAANLGSLVLGYSFQTENKFPFEIKKSQETLLWG